MESERMFGEETATRYAQWEKSPNGRFALEMEKRLLFCLMSTWSRRKQSLLDVGCGTGFFLEQFWESGFEVTGLDSSPAMLARTRERLGQRVDLHLGSADHLPFQDKDYDYVCLLTVLEFCPDPGQVLREAARVARKGLLLGFLNRWSLYYLAHGQKRRGTPMTLLRQARWFSLPGLRRLVNEHLGPRPTRFRSVLPGPRWTWSWQPPWSWMNSPMYPLPIGAYGAIRVDLLGERAMTPLLAWETEPKATP